MISPQAKVGFLVLAAIAVAITVIVNLGNVRIQKGYKFYVMFDDLGDLPARSVAKISGVNVGRVISVDLHEGRAKVEVWIRQEIKIHKDTKVKILKMGFIGNTYISMTIGTPEYPLIQEGDILEGIGPLSYEEVMDSLVSGLDRVTQVFQSLGGTDELGKDIAKAAENLRKISDGILIAIGDSGEKLELAIDNINSVLGALDELLDEEKENIKVSLSKIRGSSEDLRDIIAGVKEGRGFAGKMLTDEEFSAKIEKTVDSIYIASEDVKTAAGRVKGFDTLWDTYVYYEPNLEIFRVGVGLGLKTTAGRFLKFGLENIRPPGETDDVVDGKDPGGDRVNSFTIVGGTDIKDFSVYGGAIRSSGGLGATWLPIDRLKLRTNIFEFTREEPWWNFFTTYKLIDFLNLGVAFEDILSRPNLRTGIEFELD
jgi:phospholipid/cholesterol/gamma-HCH transport system substrate-binding protein